MRVAVDIELDDNEQQQLATILDTTLADLDSRLRVVGAAALQEYVRMFLGQKVFTRGSDIREYRLFLLIQELFGRKIPSDEQSICDLFQCTASQSRSLIRSVMSKYQYELKEAINTTLKETLDACKQDEQDKLYDVTINNENLVESLNRILASIDGTLPQISKRKGTVSTYSFSPSSYKHLCEHFNHPEPKDNECE